MTLRSIAIAMLLVTSVTCGSVFAQPKVYDDISLAESSTLDNNYIELSGKIIDSKSGREIPYVSLLAKHQNAGTVSDVHGHYSIKLPKNSQISILIRCIGYKSKEINFSTLTSQSIKDIYLEEDILGLNELVITGTRTQKTIANTPVLTQVISELYLKQNDFENIMDALEYTIPGLQFNSDPRGDNIKIQGLENKYILVLVDGERLSSTPGGPIDFERLSMSNVKQIEVIKGAASALYGSSSIGMTINIITKEPERSLEGWAKTRYAKFNDLTIDASIGSRFRNFTSQTLFYRNSYDGYNLKPENPQIYTKNPGEKTSIEQKLGWSNDRTKITSTGTFYLSEVENPKASTKNTHYKSNNKTFRAALEQKVGTNNLIKANYYGDFYTRKTVFEKTNKAQKNASSEVQTIRVMDVYTPIEKFETILGGEFNWNKDYNDIQYGEEIKTRKVNDINGFAQFDWQIIPLVNVVGGFRYTHHSVFGNAYSPKINIMVNPSNWKFRLGYSKGFKAPDATELYSDFMMGSVSHNIGNPDLKSEKSDYYYFSVEYQYKNINTSIDIYQNNVDNKIQSKYILVQNESGEEFTELRYNNVDEVRIRGLEYRIDYYPIRQLMLHGSYAYTNAKDMNTGLQLSGNTKHAISGNITYKDKLFKRDFSVSLAGRWTSSKLNDREEIQTDPNTGEDIKLVFSNPQSAYSMWKLTALYTPWRKKHMQLDISGGIQNLFDYTDPIRYTTFDAGRRAFGSIMFKF